MTALLEFKAATEFRVWLRKNHRTASEAVVRLFKVHAADRGLTYRAALDEALCYGWIDGVLHRIDQDSHSIRWTPRKPGSIWSNVNVRHVERLIREDRMAPAGLRAFAKRTADRTGIYSFEQAPATLAPELVRQFKRNRAAWKWFETQAPSYRRKLIHWVMRGKKAETRAKRFDSLVTASSRGVRL